MAVEVRAGLEGDALLPLEVLADPAEGAFENDGVRLAPERERAAQLDGAVARGDLGALEGHLREALDVEEPG